MSEQASYATRPTTRRGAFATIAAAAGMAGIARLSHAQTTGTKIKETSPSASVPAQLSGKKVVVKGSAMHYLDAGAGAPILFVHGNPTSSRLWRHVMPTLTRQGRTIAVDLIGMGQSDKPRISYTYDEQFDYFSAFIDALGLRDLTLVVHDWGAMLGFDCAARHPERVRRIAFMEGLLPPVFPQPSFEAMGPEMGGMFKAFKDPAQGHKMVISENMFLERILPGFVNRTLTPEELAAYKAPFASEADRTPLLAWPRSVPIAGEPKKLIGDFDRVQRFMTSTDMPMLLVYAEPGVLVNAQARSWYVANVRRLETAYVGAGLHFIQEDNPAAIGRAVSDWMRRT